MLVLMLPRLQLWRTRWWSKVRRRLLVARQSGRAAGVQCNLGCC